MAAACAPPLRCPIPVDGHLDYWAAPAVTTTTSLQTDAGWDGPDHRVLAGGFEALFLPDGSRWSATIFTLAEVDRLMKRWEETGEAAGAGASAARTG